MPFKNRPHLSLQLIEIITLGWVCMRRNACLGLKVHGRNGERRLMLVVDGGHIPQALDDSGTAAANTSVRGVTYTRRHLV